MYLVMSLTRVSARDGLDSRGGRACANSATLQQHGGHIVIFALLNGSCRGVRRDGCRIVAHYNTRVEGSQSMCELARELRL
jgi:hypothetical protein